ncbi:MAG TPA: EthD domain-containing protein, partial [Dehalococcoidia bacterium]|nr:EthD domain-containing protein [Dehalococcoidia bacterium]
AYDGVAELWWETRDQLATAMETEAGRRAGAALLEDEGRFIDLPQSPLWFNYEYPQINPTPETLLASPRSPYVKLYYPLRHLPTLSFDAAQLYWRTTHGPIIRRFAGGGRILRYQQIHRYDDPLEAALREARGTVVDPYTGHAEVWADRAAWGATPTPEVIASGQAALDDERNFIDFTRSTIWLGKEHQIVDRR